MELTLELAALVGSTSFEDHYWNSGWQTANVQLLAKLGHEESILEVGCGAGRLAFGLHGWFGGRYVGIEIRKEMVAYCRETFPRFTFHHLDIKSPYFTAGGRGDPQGFVLPVEDGTFDVAVLFSVFTHLLPGEARRMFAEVGRSLRPGGRCLATAFLLAPLEPNAKFKFEHGWAEGCRVERSEAPQHAVAYDKTLLAGWAAKAKLSLFATYPGSWVGRPGLGLQDQLLFVKG